MKETIFVIAVGFALSLIIIGLAQFGLSLNLDTASIASGVSNI